MYFFDDLSLIFYFSLGFLNSTFKSFEKISHYGFYWVRSKSPKSFHFFQIFTKFRDFHLKSWFWLKSGHFWSGTFWPVICLIPLTSVINLWSFLTRVFLNFVTFYGQLGVQSCIEVSKNDNFRRSIWIVAEFEPTLDPPASRDLGILVIWPFKVIFCSHDRDEILFTGFRIAFWHFINKHFEFHFGLRSII